MKYWCTNTHTNTHNTKTSSHDLSPLHTFVHTGGPTTTHCPLGSTHTYTHTYAYTHVHTHTTTTFHTKSPLHTFIHAGGPPQHAALWVPHTQTYTHTQTHTYTLQQHFTLRAHCTHSSTQVVHHNTLPFGCHHALPTGSVNLSQPPPMPEPSWVSVCVGGWVGGCVCVFM
jgi:hypothetical protein